MFSLLFPEFFYKSQVPNHKELKRKYVDLAQNAKLSVPKDWDSRVLTSRNTLNNAPFEDIQNSLVPIISDMVIQSGNKKLVNLSFPDCSIWINQYNKGHYQEYHSHCTRSNNFSFVYFVKYDKNKDGKLTFWNDRYEILSGIGIDLVLDLESLNIGNEGSVEVDEGDVIIFPSHLKHKVKRHENTSTRITIAGNFLLTPSNDK